MTLRRPSRATYMHSSPPYWLGWLVIAAGVLFLAATAEGQMTGLLFLGGAGGVGAPGPDSIGTAELDDGSDVPAAGELVAVATGATAFEYISASVLSIDWSQLLNIPADLADGDDAGTDDQTAAEVPIVDAGAFFTAIEVEAALQEIGPTMDDARAPTAHRDSHETGGTDPLVDLAGEVITSGTVADARIPAGIARDNELHPEDHATRHSLGGADVVTVTNLASACTDVEVLGGTAAGTGVECQAAVGIGGSTGATDNAILRADGTGGSTAQGSVATVTDGGGLVLPVNQAISLGGTPRGIGYEAVGTGVYGCQNFGCTIEFRRAQSGTLLGTIHTDGGSPYGGYDFRWQAGGLIAEVYLRAVGSFTADQKVINTPSAQTCTDSGDANPGALTITVSGASNIRVTNSDPDGCTYTVSETGAVDGQILWIEQQSSAGGAPSLADTPGAHNLETAWTPGAGDSINLTYNATASEWRERSRADI